ncbi:MAG: hypothetical protein P0Y53_21735 [Candidatus Pseudobacter hemicellulosilyticus]|uniref:GLPGLI family protein n=1 Tax=Candidatus Pseudobacter hemicellulosilyticus TaxID=3121375 RepID=A0AAJ6BF10_9BACT|nr:MAG: hypothetical protein P0Y53_21735 [Pseudobacter sp.]
MKKGVLCLFVGLSVTSIAEAQLQTGGVITGLNSQSSMVYPFPGRRTEEKKQPDIQGSPFTTEDWTLGEVHFRNGKMAKEVALLFNVYNNLVYFKQNDGLYEFVDPVKEFSIREKEENKETTATYRSGYPVIGKNKTETFYQVLVDGQFQLLDYRSKAIKKVRQTYSEPEIKTFEDKSLLFAYLPMGRIIKLSRPEADLTANMPEEAETITRIIEDKKLKLSKREDLIILFNELNAHYPKK